MDFLEEEKKDLVGKIFEQIQRGGEGFDFKILNKKNSDF